MLALLSTMLGIAERARWCPANVARGVKRNREVARERFLTPAEIARLLALLEARGDLPAKCIEFLLLCGCRKSEALSAQWPDFDLSGAGVWTKPPSATKSGKRHRTPLAPETVALLASLATAEAGPFAGLRGWELSRAWQSIRREAGLADVRLHDLRHSFASLLASSGTPLQVIGALLGHSQISTTQRATRIYLTMPCARRRQRLARRCAATPATSWRCRSSAVPPDGWSRRVPQKPPRSERGRGFAARRATRH
jgi:integrase